jgi:hypothetical protein
VTREGIYEYLTLPNHGAFSIAVDQLQHEPTALLLIELTV